MPKLRTKNPKRSKNYLLYWKTKNLIEHSEKLRNLSKKTQKLCKKKPSKVKVSANPLGLLAKNTYIKDILNTSHTYFQRNFKSFK